jgi:hypothetical protein
MISLVVTLRALELATVGRVQLQLCVRFTVTGHLPEKSKSTTTPKRYCDGESGYKISG